MFNPQGNDGSHCTSMGVRAAHSLTTSDDNAQAEHEGSEEAREQPDVLSRVVDGTPRGAQGSPVSDSRSSSSDSESPSSDSPESSSPSSSSSANQSPSDLPVRDKQSHARSKEQSKNSHSFLTGGDGEHFRRVNTTWQKAANWTVKLLGTDGRAVAIDRLYVRGDGSCSRGALALALASPPYNRCAAHNVRSTDVVAAVGNEIADRVETWTAQQWETRLSLEQRAEIWDWRPKCRCGLTRTDQGCICPHQTAVAERELFATQCRNTTQSMPPVFFFLASMAFQVGILLLVDIPRRQKQEPVRHVYDFGTAGYQWSMVITCLMSKEGSCGHYESVGLRDSSLPALSAETVTSHLTHQLLFPRGHPLLRTFAQYYLDNPPDKTMLARDRIHSLSTCPSLLLLGSSSLPPDRDAVIVANGALRPCLTVRRWTVS